MFQFLLVRLMIHLLKRVQHRGFGSPPLPGDDAIYSDNARFFEYPRVQVDFWIREENDDRLMDIQERIYETLHSHGFERYYKNSYPDPDLDNCIMVTANFEGFEERNDI